MRLALSGKIAMKITPLFFAGLLAAPNLALAAPPATMPLPPPGCTSDENRQLDFWVGKWNVYPKQNPAMHVADSLVEKKYTGCAIRENWMPLMPVSEGGGSLSTYVPEKKMWRQFWVDSSGAAVDFQGGWNGNAMVITGVWPAPKNPKQITRMRYMPLADGSVEQRGDTSDDNGKTWQPSFDFIYKRAQ
jgi:hypothetical protein